MDSPFVFSHEAINETFVGRRDELSWLSSNMTNKQNTVLIAPTGYGKKSLVRNAFFHAKRTMELKLCTCRLFNVRDEHAFYTLLAQQLFNETCSTESDWVTLASQLLPLSQPHIEIDECKQNGIQIYFDHQRLKDHSDEVLQLPERIADLKNMPYIVWIDDFQEIVDFENSTAFQKRLVSQWKPHRQAGYLLCGSKVNAMRALFNEKQPFHKFGEEIKIEPVDEKLFTDYIVRSFSKSGRVISKEFTEILCRKVNHYPFYVQQFAHLCWLNTKGFVIDSMMDSATEELLNYNERSCRLQVDNLSTSQLNYLRAILDGIDRFSAAEVIAKYDLHSSANITRVREALKKKEVIYFYRGKPYFIDPVFELWLQTRYFS